MRKSRNKSNRFEYVENDVDISFDSRSNFEFCMEQFSYQLSHALTLHFWLFCEFSYIIFNNWPTTRHFQTQFNQKLHTKYKFQTRIEKETRWCDRMFIDASTLFCEVNWSGWRRLLNRMLPEMKTEIQATNPTKIVCLFLLSCVLVVYTHLRVFVHCYMQMYFEVFDRINRHHSTSACVLMRRRLKKYRRGISITKLLTFKSWNESSIYACRFLFLQEESWLAHLCLHFTTLIHNEQSLCLFMPVAGVSHHTSHWITLHSVMHAHAASI